MLKVVAVGAALAGLGLASLSPASAEVRFDPSLNAKASPSPIQAQYHGGRGYYGRGYGYGGGGVAAGIAGLAAGAIIGGALAAQSQPAYPVGAYGYYPNGYYPDYGYQPAYSGYYAPRYHYYHRGPANSLNLTDGTNAPAR